MFTEVAGGTNFDLHLLSMGGESSVRPLLVTDSIEWHAAISPDGRWIAYGSDESGGYEVYVRPFPNVDDGKWSVSSRGGWKPVWGRQGGELFYEGVPSGDMILVRYKAEPSFEPRSPEVLFSGSYYSVELDRHYDIHPDGQKFLMIKEGEASRVTHHEIIVVQNWFEELQRLVPTEE